MEKLTRKITKYSFLVVGIAGVAGVIGGNYGHVLTAAAGFIIYGMLRSEQKREEEGRQ